MPNLTHPPCTRCQKPLEPEWRLCPYCGVQRSRPVKSAAPATIWRLRHRYRQHVRDSLLPFLRSIAAAESESLEVKVEAFRPARYADALAVALRGLAELAEDTSLPPEFRLALTVRGRSRKHDAIVGQALAPAIAEVHAATQALVNAGDINAGLLQQVHGILEQREQTASLAEIGATLTGIDAGMVRIAVRILASWFDTSRANARQERWKQACVELIAAGDRLLEQSWDDLARRTQTAGLRLREAQELQELETEATAHWTRLVEQQAAVDGQFEQMLTQVHALARRHPDAYPIEQLRKHADLLAEVRGVLVGNWLTRIVIGIQPDGLARAQQHFLRLLPGDGVLVFIGTTFFGHGKAGFALTTSSVQWRDSELLVHRYGYAELSKAHIEWTSTHLIINETHISDLGEPFIEAAGRALLACIRLSLAAPGPAVCPCGAPGHWLRFDSYVALCPGCRGTVNYA